MSAPTPSTGSASEGCDEAEQATAPVNQQLQSANLAIVTYLSERVEEFRTLSELRQKGWNNKEGDAFFQRQREQADKCSAQSAKFFYQMMDKIATELDRTTGAFRIHCPSSTQPSILDFCMAPGSFLGAALRLNPASWALAFSLPRSSGGHQVLLPSSPNTTLKFLDVTMLAADMGVTEIPADHPDARNFLPQEFHAEQLFDLIICDGQILRTHARRAYRERREARRLLTTQLALGLEHVRPNGTMVVLLHKVEAWDTVCLLYTFSKFSTVQLFKPISGHAKRSSFYMVAANIDSSHPEAMHAIQGWKTTWMVATFGTEEEYYKAFCEEELTAKGVLAEFGAELVRLGRKVWDVQAKALAKAPFIKD